MRLPLKRVTTEMHAPKLDAEELCAEIEQLHEQSFAWALVCCRRDRAEAEDVLQTTYLKVLDGRARFAGEGKLKTWLFAVIRRTAAGRRRQRVVREGLLAAVGLFRGSTEVGSRGQRPVQVSEPPQPPSTLAPSMPPNPEAAAQQSQRQQRLREGLQGLSVRQREVLELVFYQDLSIEQAAQVLGISLGTARIHYSRGKKRFAEILKSREVEDEYQA